MNLIEGAKFWFNDVGVDVISSDTKNKKMIVELQKYQNNWRPVDECETFIKEGKYEKGLITKTMIKIQMNMNHIQICKVQTN